MRFSTRARSSEPKSGMASARVLVGGGGGLGTAGFAASAVLLASPSTTRRLGDFAGDLAGSFAGDLAACCMRLLTGRQTVQSSSSCSSMVVLGSLTSNLRDLSSSSLTSIVYPSCSSSGSFGFSAVPLTMSGFASDCAVTHSCSCMSYVMFVVE